MKTNPTHSGSPIPSRSEAPHDLQRLRWSARIVVVAFLALGLASARDTGPDASLSPSAVVRLQVEALGQGRIDTAFRFASPANRIATGPLARFAEIVRAPEYEPMLSYAAAHFESIGIIGSRAAVVATVLSPEGDRHAYLFELTRESAGELAGCWLTDSVVHIASDAPERIAI